MSTLKQVVIVSQNPAASARAYEDLLGLEVTVDDGAKWIQFDTGETSLAIAAPTEAAVPVGSAVPVFETSDLALTLQRATMAVAALVERRDMGSHGRAALVRDAHGAAFLLHQSAREADGAVAQDAR